MNRRGQLLLPMLGLLLIFGILLAGYLRWCRGVYWQMRMDLAAEAAALSAARAQAEMLNQISFLNSLGNVFVQKTGFPSVSVDFGIMAAELYPSYLAWNRTLRATVAGFRTFPVTAGQEAARLNGAQGVSPYFPASMNPLLIPRTIEAVLYTQSTPPLLFHRTLTGAYFARGWGERFLKAQPPHHTTWMVSRGNARAVASAALWHDAPPDDSFNNGGFPRKSDAWLRSAGIQGFYPHFNARLLGQPRISRERLLDSWRRWRSQ